MKKKLILIGLIIIAVLSFNVCIVNAVEEEETSEVEEQAETSVGEAFSTGLGAEGSSTEEDWTDFSNAKIELKKDGIAGAVIEISNVIPRENSDYYLFITSNSNKPDVTRNSDGAIHLQYDNENQIFKTLDSGVAGSVELNQELYVSILENHSTNQEVILYGQKIERFSESNYTEGFWATFMANDGDQLITTFTHSSKNDRKLQIKVGKITDISILQKIKNQDVSAFAELLSFAKLNNGIFNENVDAQKNNYAIGYYAYDASNISEGKIIDLNGLEDDAYYFLYIKTDDENGKYIPTEAVTLAQANVFNNGNWSLIFYGAEDFIWNLTDVVDTTDGKDETVATFTIPQTGESIIILGVIAATLVVAIISIKKYRRNNF